MDDIHWRTIEIELKKIEHETQNVKSEGTEGFQFEISTCVEI